MGYSFFNRVEEAPADAIFQLGAAFMEDPRPHKVNLSVGLYRDDKLETPILKTVKAAEKYLLSSETTKEYLPISGDATYLEESGKLIFGEKGWNAHREKIGGIQTPGGTAGLRMGGDFIRQEIGDRIALPEPTWPNHLNIFKRSGFQIDSYGYYDLKKQMLDLSSIFSALKKMPARSTVLFHACCHNPTGADLSEREWEQVADILQERELLLFFDFAYQGFGKGIEKDAAVIRMIAERSMECVVASSYSKNFGLYSERVGSVFMVTQKPEAARHVVSKLKAIARASYSNPPRHGASIVAHILSQPNLKKEWTHEVDAMRKRIEKLRKQFVTGLAKSHDYSYLLDRVGMFCYLGLEKEKVEKLREEYGIYMTSDGRINLAGLSQQNLPYVLQAMLKIL